MNAPVPRVIVKSPREIALMRDAGRVVAEVLDAIGAQVRPGATTADFDRIASHMIRDAGATALFLGVRNPQARRPFPASICASVNEAIVHGVPNDRPLQSGDIVSVDCGVRLKGYCGDSARTFAVGEPSESARRLMEVTQAALDLAIREVRPQRRWSEVAGMMQALIEGAGFGVVRDFVGHGIGREMHEEPQLPNYADRGGKAADFPLYAGMTLAIEPMVTVGQPTWDYARWDRDRWTVVTRDGSLAAHFEHTVAVSDQGGVVLTAA